jgi:hypothetical protein
MGLGFGSLGVEGQMFRILSAELEGWVKVR